MAKNIFNSVKFERPRRNYFDLTHDVKLSCRMGQLIPIMCMETLPGDRVKIACESLLRFQPLVSPVMHRMSVTMHYFFVPYRLLWPSWEDFITNTKDDVTDLLPAYPYITTDGSLTDLMDYFGIPASVNGDQTQQENISALQFAAYQMIYNEYYRDQNLIPEIPFELVDGDNSASFTNLTTIRRRAWEHDYFTSCLPWAQKGDTVDLPLGTVELDPDAAVTDTPGLIRNAVDHTLTAPDQLEALTGGVFGKSAVGPVETPLVYDPNGTLQVGATTINDLRLAYRVQEWLEKLARGGSRYKEMIWTQFGVRTSDSRLDRPEYITGTKAPVIISEVVNTAGGVDEVQGNMAGHGIAVTDGKSKYYNCEEFGCIIGIMSVMPKTAYQQGIEKQWLRRQPTEFYFPPFANLGEQAVLNREVYAYTSNAADTFGYNPRYAEYRFMNNRVAGDMRSTLDFWHLGRIFANEPALNQDFIECVPDNRIFAVDAIETQPLIAHVLNKVGASRLMPKYATPTF